MLIRNELTNDFARDFLRVRKKKQPPHDLWVRPVQMQDRPVVHSEFAQYETFCLIRSKSCHVSLKEWTLARFDLALIIRTVASSNWQ